MVKIAVECLGGLQDKPHAVRLPPAAAGSSYQVKLTGRALSRARVCRGELGDVIELVGERATQPPKMPGGRASKVTL